MQDFLTHTEPTNADEPRPTPGFFIGRASRNNTHMVRETELGTDVMKQLSYVRAVDRDDALQVAWLAFLEYQDPAKVVDNWRRKESRRRARELTNYLVY